jgi:hypothetical protein
LAKFSPFNLLKFTTPFITFSQRKCIHPFIIFKSTIKSLVEYYWQKTYDIILISTFIKTQIKYIKLRGKNKDALKRNEYYKFYFKFPKSFLIKEKFFQILNKFQEFPFRSS